ncbi:hypothetical protein A2U01_0038295 [Trifolium medium]|uniref:Uncharacterized protein n=1 Tax=Trifolium medium TaxID=97028 RepID=A0A392PZ78_9FABA|nr:hypothetical protein [Trifolium medium]
MFSRFRPDTTKHSRVTNIPIDVQITEILTSREHILKYNLASSVEISSSTEIREEPFRSCFQNQESTADEIDGPFKVTGRFSKRSSAQIYEEISSPPQVPHLVTVDPTTHLPDSPTLLAL